MRTIPICTCPFDSQSDEAKAAAVAQIQACASEKDNCMG